MAEHLAKIIGYSPLKLNKARHLEFEKAQEPLTIPMISNDLVGIEIEMENMPNWYETSYYWTAKKDGSLRNNGVEYVSIPMRGDQLEHALNHLNRGLKGYNPDFSDRTSTHVHLNVRDITQEQLANLIVLYSMFEKHFFKFAKPCREESLFCVPVYATPHVSQYRRFVYDLVPVWCKYMALNILPVLSNNDTGCYGTIEFRHLHGTMDTYEITTFVNSILCLKQEARKWKHDDLIDFLAEANSTSAYNALYHQMFGGLARNDLNQYEIEYCISQLKRNIFKDAYKTTLGLQIHSDQSYLLALEQLKVY